MTVKEFIEKFNIIDRNIYIFPKTKKDLTYNDGTKSPYTLAVYKYNKSVEYMAKTIKKCRFRYLQNVGIYRLSKPKYTIEEILNAEVWRISTDCSWYDRVPPICLYIKDIELITLKENYRRKKALKQQGLEEEVKDTQIDTKDIDIEESQADESLSDDDVTESSNEVELSDTDVNEADNDEETSKTDVNAEVTDSEEDDEDTQIVEPKKKRNKKGRKAKNKSNE